MKFNFHVPYFILFLFVPVFCFSQIPARWNVNGNATVNGDFLGTTNNQPLIFYTNNTEKMRLSANGQLTINNLSGLGNGFITVSNTGILGNTPFTNDANQVLTGAGTFRNISSLNPWVQTEDYIYFPSGDVGIGTSTPQAKFDVNGSMRVRGTLNLSSLAAERPVQICIDPDGNIVPIVNPGIEYCNSSSLIDWNTRGNGGTDANVDFIGTCDEASLLFRTFNTQRMSISSTGDFNLGNGQSGNNFFVIPNLAASSYNQISQTGDVGIFWADSYGGNTNSSFVIAPWSHTAFGLRITADGNVGIGTPSPQYTLDVNGTINATQILQNGNPLSSPWTQTGDDIFFDLNSATNGSVGIGVAGTSSFFTCPTCTGGKYLLAVDGGIRAKTLKVEPLWSDYVFDSTYYLAPLDSVAEYIKMYHHLPGVQSAENVKENGIDVGETEAMLLAKIEELTLYMIQIQQQNISMQKQIDALQK